MKVRGNYTLFINGFTRTASWGGDEFENRILGGEGRTFNALDVGAVYDCTFDGIKSAIKQLRSEGYSILKYNW